MRNHKEINTKVSDAIFVAGNKCDRLEERVIPAEAGERLAREFSVVFMETSAKTGLNVDLAFTAIAR
ncbi:MAG: hypothetical protein AAGF14_02525 [Pseudomonadota bacterium]